MAMSTAWGRRSASLPTSCMRAVRSDSKDSRRSSGWCTATGKFAIDIVRPATAEHNAETAVLPALDARQATLQVQKVPVMTNSVEVKVPDIGDFKNVPVVEVLVKPGDTVQ